MAIYKNREVTIVNPNKFQVPATVTIEYKDGSHEVVSLGQVAFTKDERDSLVKTNPSDFQDVAITTDDDLKAVRLGVTPPSDPVLKQQAETKARHEKQMEQTQKQMDAAKAQVEKDLEKKPSQSQSTQVSQTVPTTYQVPNQDQK